MKDFDEARAERRNKTVEQRSFKLCGETLVMRPSVPFETLGRWEDVEGKIGTDAVAKVNEVFLEFLEPDSHDAYRSVIGRGQHEDHLSYPDLREVVAWMLSEHSKRPTRASSSSDDGRATNGASSTGDSSSPEPISSGSISDES